jgi:hypothetical protein
VQVSHVTQDSTGYCVIKWHAIIGNTSMLKSMRATVLVCFLAQPLLATCSFAQQTTGQLLISSGFNPIAATTPDHVVLERVESGCYAYSRVWLMELSL